MFVSGGSGVTPVMSMLRTLRAERFDGDIAFVHYASANLTGGKLFHLLSGNLSFQIGHHLFPDIPAHRHAEISQEVREICRRYGVPYHTGPLPRQFGTVVHKIVRLALPPRRAGGR